MRRDRTGHAARGAFAGPPGAGRPPALDAPIRAAFSAAFAPPLPLAAPAIRDDRDVNAAKNILRLAIEPKQPVGNGLLRVEGTLNLPANVVGSPGEARTVAEKFTHGARLDRAA